MGIRDFFRADERKASEDTSSEDKVTSRRSEVKQPEELSDDTPEVEEPPAKPAKAASRSAAPLSATPPERTAAPSEDEDTGVESGVGGGEISEGSSDDRSTGRGGRSRLPGYSNAAELLTAEIPARVTYVDAKLRSNLVGSIVINLRDSGEKYLFDWTTEELKTGRFEGGSSDCTINLSGQNLLRIASGDLNPQVAMLSDKIKVDGRVGLAIYFFNLVAPRTQA